jgi:bile acid:Na+ symporter, BASS family
MIPTTTDLQAVVLSDGDDDRGSTRPSTTMTTKLDVWLSQCTMAFPLFVLGAAVVGYLRPHTLLWVNSGSMVTIMLASVMFGTGLTLQKNDFTNVWKVPSNRLSVPLGVLCQFMIMPSTAYIVGRLLLLTSGGSIRGSSAVPPTSIQSALFLGLCFVGCSPGGTASNLVALIAHGDVALSVILTTCSTLAAVVMTPLLVKLLVRYSSIGIVGSNSNNYMNTMIDISGWSLCVATAKVVLLPIIGGMLLKSRTPQLATTISRFTPFASVLLVSLICGGVVAQTAPLFVSSSTSGIALPMVLTSVVVLHVIGFAAGYLVPKLIYPNKEKTARTISIEVGMQNSALAVVLARSIPGIHPAASLPGALSATVHSCLGSVLAAVWRWRSTATTDEDQE